MSMGMLVVLYQLYGEQISGSDDFILGSGEDFLLGDGSNFFLGGA